MGTSGSLDRVGRRSYDVQDFGVTAIPVGRRLFVIDLGKIAWFQMLP